MPRFDMSKAQIIATISAYLSQGRSSAIVINVTDDLGNRYDLINVAQEGDTNVVNVNIKAVP